MKHGLAVPKLAVSMLMFLEERQGTFKAECLMDCMGDTVRWYLSEWEHRSERSSFRESPITRF